MRTRTAARRIVIVLCGIRKMMEAKGGGQGAIAAAGSGVGGRAVMRHAFLPGGGATAGGTTSVAAAAARFSSLLLLAASLVMSGDAYGEEATLSLEGGVTVGISYPDGLVAGREGIVSILVTNGGWEDKQEISFAVSLSDDMAITADPPTLIEIGDLAAGGTYGANLGLFAAEDAGPGTHYLNLRYTHVLVANNETPQAPFFYDIAVPVEIREDARVTISTQTPESIFANAEFPVMVGVTTEDVDIRDVRIRVIPPAGIEFRGETTHSFSKVDRGVPVEITARIVTPVGEVATEHRLPFEVIVDYVDDVGEEKTDAQTFSVILRPRTFMELTTDGGIWVGDFFIAPYVSLGTIIGIPLGAIFSLFLKRRFGEGRRGGGNKDGPRRQPRSG